MNEPPIRYKDGTVFAARENPYKALGTVLHLQPILGIPADPWWESFVYEVEWSHGVISLYDVKKFTAEFRALSEMKYWRIIQTVNGLHYTNFVLATNERDALQRLIKAFPVAGPLSQIIIESYGVGSLIPKVINPEDDERLTS